MTAGRFGLLEIRELARAAMAALRPVEPVVFQEYRPLPPADVRLLPREPLHLPPDPGMGGGLAWGALGVSVVIHGGVLAFVLTHQLLIALPDGGQAQQAAAPISVELVDTRVFQALVEGQQTEAAPAPAASDATAAAPPPPEPSTTAALPEEQQEAQPQPVTAEAPSPQPEKIAAADAVTPPVLAVPDAETSETVSPAAPETNVTATPSRTEPPQPETKVKPDARAKPEHRRHQRHASLGSKASAGESGAEASAARASASRGAVLGYGSRVQAHLAANRPSGGLGSGTVKVSFVLSPSGGLLSAHVSRSSGRPALDRRALSAVRAASPYPVPPAGINAAQRSFTFPFYFE